jgi:hypothetical protein
MAAFPARTIVVSLPISVYAALAGDGTPSGRL